MGKVEHDLRRTHLPGSTRKFSISRLTEIILKSDNITAMWPFKKSASCKDQLPIDGPWTVAEGQHNSQIMIVRSNTGYRELGSVSGYEHQVGIAIPLREPGTNSMPSPAETLLLDEVEDIVCNSLEEQADSLLVAVITTNGMREFVFYTRDPKSVQSRFDEISSRITTHKLQLMIQLDKAWQVYNQL